MKKSDFTIRAYALPGSSLHEFRSERGYSYLEITSPDSPEPKTCKIPFTVLSRIMIRKVAKYLKAKGKERDEIGVNIVRAFKAGYMLRSHPRFDPQGNELRGVEETEGTLLRTYRYLSFAEGGATVGKAIFSKKPPKRFLGIGRTAIDLWGEPKPPSI
ncbi:Uncharacterised protein [Candidatus Norongarragalina meridionalis]|nr:Uncharacterised protein [Candidatus Norongarragalina meridionalis]